MACNCGKKFTQTKATPIRPGQPQTTQATPAPVAPTGTIKARPVGA